MGLGSLGWRSHPSVPSAHSCPCPQFSVLSVTSHTHMIQDPAFRQYFFIYTRNDAKACTKPGRPVSVCRVPVVGRRVSSCWLRLLPPGRAGEDPRPKWATTQMIRERLGAKEQEAWAVQGQGQVQSSSQAGLRPAQTQKFPRAERRVQSSTR